MKEKLIFNYLCDLKKEEIDPKERADLITQFLVENKMSQRELARKIGIPHSTIQDWCLYAKLTPEEIANLKEKYDMNDTQIYRMLRNNKRIEKNEFVKKTGVEWELEEAIRKLSGYILHPRGENVKQLIHKLKNILNRMEMYVDKQ